MPSDPPGPPITDALTRAMALLTNSHPLRGAETVVRTEVPDLIVMGAAEPTELAPTKYDPVVCMILQGEKELDVGADRLACPAGAAVVVSHTIPVASQITRASQQQPYVAAILGLDVGILADLLSGVDDLDHSPSSSAVVVTPVGESLADAMARLLLTAADPNEASVVAPLTIREIHYRLLVSSSGPMLRSLVRGGSHASRVSRAIALLRENLDNSPAVADLAKHVHMSPSSLHAHFKAVTGNTPIQFHKRLRLLEAQRLLQLGELSVTEIALSVGYRSPTQFSRDYKRLFAVAPSKARRAGATATR